MVTDQTRRIAGLLLVVVFGQVGLASGQSDADSLHRQAELRRQRSALQFQKQLETLEGNDAYAYEKIHVILDWMAAHDAKDAKNDEFLANLAPLADKIRNQEHVIDEKDAFFKAFIDWACKNFQDNCELRQQFAILEARIAELEGRNDSFVDPTPAEPTPAEPPLEPTPAPWPPEGSLVPPPLVWDRTLDYITDRRDNFCHNAERVARCINYRFADGSVAHGDVYHTCRGNYVLLRHAPRFPNQYVLLYR